MYPEPIYRAIQEITTEYLLTSTTGFKPELVAKIVSRETLQNLS
jgi:hypothetical protein